MILTDFQIYISVPLSDEKIIYDSELNNNASLYYTASQGSQQIL